MYSYYKNDELHYLLQYYYTLEYYMALLCISILRILRYDLRRNYSYKNIVLNTNQWHFQIEKRGNDHLERKYFRQPQFIHLIDNGK
jgi:hypothetical protein